MYADATATLFDLLAEGQGISLPKAETPLPSVMAGAIPALRAWYLIRAMQ
jgi:hypothetical protein